MYSPAASTGGCISLFEPPVSETPSTQRQTPNRDRLPRHCLRGQVFETLELLWSLGSSFAICDLRFTRRGTCGRFWLKRRLWAAHMVLELGAWNLEFGVCCLAFLSRLKGTDFAGDPFTFKGTKELTPRMTKFFTASPEMWHQNLPLFAGDFAKPRNSLSINTTFKWPPMIRR